MGKKKNKGITVKKEDDMPEWYEQVIIKSELAEHAPIKGCMVIRPGGYAVWQAIQDWFNPVMKNLGVKNAYFPMFIPEHFFQKEASHAEGFSPEVAWIQPKTEDKQRYALRPTSETIMYDAYAKWIRSWRDLPLRINQWCNICRWEVQDCKLFLRSREFLWQEGHCVYETEKECEKEARMMLREYKRLAEELLAVPVIMGQKTEREKFAGAKRTYTIETLMPDGKALQLGTSHNLGRGFAKAFDITYRGKDEEDHHPWQTSWGISTRMIGAMVMMHSDDQGLVLPPRVAEKQVVIVPILFDDSRKNVLAACDKIAADLEKVGVRVMVDDRESHSPGYKFNEWEMKGIPLRIEVGPRDFLKKNCVIARRDTGKKLTFKLSALKKEVPTELESMQKALLSKAKKMITKKTVRAKNWDEFTKEIKKGNWVKVYFHETTELELEIKDKLKVTTRCIPLHMKVPKGAKCFYSGKKATIEVIMGRNY
jgi:prolyl-tRNA synthetase